MIWTIGVIAALGLAAVTVYLILLNWNQQLGATLLSVALGGTVTLFIAVFNQLKESSVSGQFAVDIPFDTATGFPQVFPEGLPEDESGFRRRVWLSRLHSIAVQPHMPTPEPGKSSQVDLSTIARAVSTDEMFTACSQLLQYKLLEDLRDHQRVSGATPKVVDGYEIPSVQVPPLAGPVSDVPQDQLQEMLRTNQFHVQHAFMWMHRTLRIPPKSRIFLRHVRSSPTTGVTKDLIVVEWPNYFRGVITVEPLGAGGVGQSTVKKVRVVVTMKATMFKLAAGSSASAGAKAWFEWLFQMLEVANTA